MVIPWVGFPLADLHQARRADGEARSSSSSRRCCDPQPDAGRSASRCSTGRTSRGCASTRRCTRSTILAVGLYGEVLPNQNGAPLRLVVPWKYGFKSIKSIVRIRFVEKQPVTAWKASAPQEYGFYSNVNPEVDHPRWSQARERRIGEFFKRKTLMFNGYADQVAGLYAGMDLKKNY